MPKVTILVIPNKFAGDGAARIVVWGYQIGRVEASVRAALKKAFGRPGLDIKSLKEL